ncbi:MAG: hypothetical protein KDI60_10475, partial [Xanthomonadales bacterium]|nr:hypothetical protein [Xanthomonadales bacterium]
GSGFQVMAEQRRVEHEYTSQRTAKTRDYAAATLWPLRRAMNLFEIMSGDLKPTRNPSEATTAVIRKGREGRKEGYGRKGGKHRDTLASIAEKETPDPARVECHTIR